jgi:hypothetical protein
MQAKKMMGVEIITGKDVAFKLTFFELPPTHQDSRHKGIAKTNKIAEPSVYDDVETTKVKLMETFQKWRYEIQKPPDAGMTASWGSPQDIGKLSVASIALVVTLFVVFGAPTGGIGVAGIVGVGVTCWGFPKLWNWMTRAPQKEELYMEVLHTIATIPFLDRFASKYALMPGAYTHVTTLHVTEDSEANLHDVASNVVNVIRMLRYTEHFSTTTITELTNLVNEKKFNTLLITTDNKGISFIINNAESNEAYNETMRIETKRVVDSEMVNIYKAFIQYKPKFQQQVSAVVEEPKTTAQHDAMTMRDVVARDSK